MIPVTLRKLALAILLSGIISGCGPDADMSSKAHANRAQQLLDEGKLKPAILEIKNALRTEPTDAELRWLAGTIYLEAGENAAAEKEFAKAIELGIHNVDSELSLVRSWVAQGKLKEGLDYFGAKELSSTAGELESVLRERQGGISDNLLLRFSQSLDQVINVIGMIDDTSLEPLSWNGPKADGNIILLKKFLGKLRPLLMDREAKSCKEIVKEMSSYNWPSEYAESIQQLSSYVGKYKFKQAQNLLDKMIEHLES